MQTVKFISKNFSKITNNHIIKEKLIISTDMIFKRLKR